MMRAFMLVEALAALANATALRAWQITSSNEPSVGIRLFLAGETTRQILMR